MVWAQKNPTSIQQWVSNFEFSHVTNFQSFEERQGLIWSSFFSWFSEALTPSPTFCASCVRVGPGPGMRLSFMVVVVKCFEWGHSNTNNHSHVSGTLFFPDHPCRKFAMLLRKWPSSLHTAALQQEFSELETEQFIVWHVNMFPWEQPSG